MKKNSACYLYSLFLFFSCYVSAQYIQVNDNYTAQQLVQDVLINSSCATVSNFSVSGGNFGNGVQSYGYFSGANTSFPFLEGIVLSTGRAVMTEGPNTSLLDDGSNMDWGGDADLELALSINNSVNATVLEFDFVPLGNRISFDYMLSSEEYHDDAPCWYSDGFAFILQEVNSTEPFDNLAVVPGTFIPVKVTSVHPQIGGSGGCEAQNEQFFGDFNGPDHPTNFNGQTAVMQARANVTPGVLYHIKLVIADEGNYRYDSAIFIGGGSFNVTTDLGPDRVIVNNNPLCTGATLPLNASNPGAISYQWFKNGAAIAGETNAEYIVRTEGNYSVKVQLTQTCFSEGRITVEYTAPPVVANQTLLQCDDDNDGLTLFNLTLADALLSNGSPNISAAYYLTQQAATAGTSPISNPTRFQNTMVNQEIYALVSNQFGCSTIVTVTLATSSNSITSPTPLIGCEEDNDGLHVFNLNEKSDEILQALPPGLQLQYFTSYNAALSAVDAIADPTAFQTTTPGSQTVYARVFNGSECYGIAQLHLNVSSFGSSFNDQSAYLCNNSIITLNAGSGYTSYTWNTTPVQTTPTITVSEPSSYTVTVVNSDGCSRDRNFTVMPSGPATGAAIDINDFTGNQNSISVIPQGNGNYEYSLNGATYQAAPVFNGLLAGQYTIYIRDINGCLPVYTQEVYVLDYPKFFTPNGDGINDVWRIPFLTQRKDIIVTVFDRYGKVITGFKGTNGGWDGTLNGELLPSTDYWFTIQLEDMQIIRGHFAMMR
jgi:gliding motility-associated-like protein